MRRPLIAINSATPISTTTPARSHPVPKNRLSSTVGVTPPKISAAAPQPTPISADERCSPTANSAPMSR